MARADELRKYVRRDWRLLEQTKQEFWLNRRRRRSAVAALRVADALREEVRAIRPDWPSPDDRASDLAAHTRLAETLARARPVAKR
jgi:hypothetical protein